MQNRRDFRAMDDRELRSYRRALRLRRARRQKIMTASVAVFAAICMVLICSLSYRAIKSNASSGFKYYTSITVEAGDTLWDIANKYMDSSVYRSLDDYMDEIREINSINYNRIYNGQQLIIPYYSEQLR